MLYIMEMNVKIIFIVECERGIWRVSLHMVGGSINQSFQGVTRGNS